MDLKRNLAISVNELKYKVGFIVSELINPLDDKVNNLIDEVIDLNNNTVTTLQKEINDNKDDIVVIQNDITDINNEITLLKAEDVNLQNQIDMLTMGEGSLTEKVNKQTNAIKLLNDLTSDGMMILSRNIRDLGNTLDQSNSTQILNQWSPCDVFYTVKLNAPVVFTNLSSITYDELIPLWVRIYGLFNIRTNHELTEEIAPGQYKLILPMTNQLTVTSPTGISEININTQSGFDTFSLFPTSLTTVVDGSDTFYSVAQFPDQYPSTTINSPLLYSIRQVQTEGISSIKKKMFGDEASAQSFLRYNNDGTGFPYNQTNVGGVTKDMQVFRIATRYNIGDGLANSDIDTFNINGTGIFFARFGKLIFSDRIVTSVDTPPSTDIFNLLFRSSNPAITFFTPIPSTTISTSTNNAIGSVLLKDNLPQFQSTYNNLISVNDVSDSPELNAPDQKKLYNVFSLGGTGINKKILADATTSSTNSEVVFIFPIGSSIRIVMPQAGEWRWFNNQAQPFAPFTTVQDAYVSTYITSLIHPNAWTRIDNTKTVYKFIKFTTNTPYSKGTPTPTDGNNGNRNFIVFLGTTASGMKDSAQLHVINGQIGDGNPPSGSSTFVAPFLGLSGINTDSLITIEDNSETLAASSTPSNSALYFDNVSNIATSNIVRERAGVSVGDQVIINNKYFFGQRYPTMTHLITDISESLRVMAPPPSYIWTLNDLSFSIQQRLQIIETQLISLNSSINLLNQILFEALALTDLGLSLLADQITLVANNVTILSDRLSSVTEQLDRRLAAVEEYINQQIQQMSLDFEGDFVSTILGLTLGAAALALTRSPAIASAVYDYTTLIATNVYKGAVFLQGAPETLENYQKELTSAMALGGILGQNGCALQSGALPEIPPVTFAVDNSLRDRIQAAQANLQAQPEVISYAPPVADADEIDSILLAITGTKDTGETITGANIFKNLIDTAYINESTMKRTELTDLLNSL